MKLHPEELAAILAGLRLIQQSPALPPAIADIYTDSGALAGLTNAEIDGLCERLNQAKGGGES